MRNWKNAKFLLNNMGNYHQGLKYALSECLGIHPCVLWGRCPALTQILQLITPSRASGTADHVRSLDYLIYLLWLVYIISISTLGMEGIFGCPKYFGQIIHFFCCFGFPQMISLFLRIIPNVLATGLITRTVLFSTLNVSINLLKL